MLRRQVRVPNRQAEIRGAVALVNQFGADNGLPDSIICDLNVALDDALNNIIAYGDEDGAADEIVVTLGYAPPEVLLEVEDGGRAFDPLQMPPPDLTAPLQDRKVGGLGIHLIRNLMDDVSYTRTVDKNCLRMVKTVSPGIPRSASAPDTPAANPGPRILVVDDNDDNRYTLALYLDVEGYTNVVTAQDGEEAIARLERESFDLVLLDVMMPKTDGYGVLAWLKDKNRLHNLPVIMVSALNEMNSVVRCIELGAVDYLTKPFNPVLLRARLGASLDKKRLRDQVRAHLKRLEDELEAARKLQMGMVPRSFPAPSRDFPWDIHASIEPAREVGGDLYDVFRIADGSLCFFIGDVSGKGMPAALFMARTKSIIRIVTDLMRTNGMPAGPADIMARVNRELCRDNESTMFVTLFFGMLSAETGVLSYCNAGHNPPYRLGNSGPSAINDATGVVLGVDPAAAYAPGTLALEPGETLVLYTDGVTEAFNAANEPFSEERLCAVLAERGRSCAQIVEAVAAAIKNFVGDTPRSDDVALLALRRAC
jgi:sigma-B regulation protein RsbU (phosphoserine phosphatase)